MPLSATQLRAIIGKQYKGSPELADRDGLGVRISPAGTITWQYRYRFKGKAARLDLGRCCYPAVKVTEARKLIPDLNHSITSGIDPKIYWMELDKSRVTPTIINSIKACILTGSRISELLKARHEDFDLESMLWTVPVDNSKTNLPIRRPITPRFLEILEFQWSLYHATCEGIDCTVVNAIGQMIAQWLFCQFVYDGW